MKSAKSQPPPVNAKRSRPKGAVALRTGKIYAAKASASQIRAIVGVKPADDRVAAKALRAASSKETAGEVAPEKRTRDETTSKSKKS